jgi:hypothetical protein
LECNAGLDAEAATDALPGGLLGVLRLRAQFRLRPCPGAFPVDACPPAHCGWDAWAGAHLASEEDERLPAQERDGVEKSAVPAQGGPEQDEERPWERSAQPPREEALALCRPGAARFAA